MKEGHVNDVQKEHRKFWISIQMEAHLKVKQNWRLRMQMNATITKIVKSSDTIDEKERNQFVIHVKVRKECSYGIQKQEEEDREPSFEDRKAWVKSSKVAMRHQT